MIDISLAPLVHAILQVIYSLPIVAGVVLLVFLVKRGVGRG